MSEPELSLFVKKIKITQICGHTELSHKYTNQTVTTYNFEGDCVVEEL
jgi:hypothetical protein